MITGVHVNPFLGIAPTGNRVFMRDCDWWRCSKGKIVENWCMLDTLHLVKQLGVDVIEELTLSSTQAGVPLAQRKPIGKRLALIRGYSWIES